MGQIVESNGETFYIGSDKDLVEVIEKYAGRDIARILDARLVEIDEEIAYAEYRAQTDCDTYERECENWQSMMMDVHDTLSELYDEVLSAKRLNRDKICKVLRVLCKELIGNL